MAQHFRMACRLRAYDLYHEPNFIPLPCEQPTLATLHDLSVVLHPEWHPADRAAYFKPTFIRVWLAAFISWPFRSSAARR